MKVSDLKFNIELKSSYSRATSRFPSDNVVGAKMKRTNLKAESYKLKLSFPEAVCKKSQFRPLGYISIQISDCSNALKINYESAQGENFKGYAIRPIGTYRNNDKLKQDMKKDKNFYLSSYAEITVPFELLDTKHCRPFDGKYPPILASGKHYVIVDISDLSLYVKG